MNVLLVVYDFSRGGGCERVALNLYRELQKQINVKFVSLFRQHTKSPLDDSDVTYLLKKKGSFRRDSFAMVKILNDIACEFKTDIVMSIGINSSLYCCLTGKHVRAKTIVCEHSNLANVFYNSKRQLIKRKIILCFCDKLITLTHEDMMEYCKRYPKYKSKFSYIYNWIDVTTNQIKNIYNNESKKIVTVCRIDRIKGIERSIEIFKQLEDNYPEWTWEIYGDGDDIYLEELKNIIYHNKVKRFYLMGYCSNTSDVYKNASIYACNSYFEGLPISLLEAKAWHIPIISFDCKTGPRDIIEDNINGILILGGDNDTFKQKLELLMQNDDYRMKLSSNAYTNMHEFRKETVIKKWIALFDEVLKMKF